MVRSFRSLLTWGLVGAAISACEPRAPDEPAISAAERAQLQALGYVDASSQVADREREGAIVHDAVAAQPGYRLYSADTACEADLIDVKGELIRRWRGAPCGKWSHAQLLPDGDLLVIGTPPNTPGGVPRASYLLRQDWNGAKVFELPIRAHHDAAPLPDGTLLALALSELLDEEVFPEGRVTDNPILSVSARGEPGPPVSLLSVLKTREGECAFRKPVESHPGRADPLHMNSILWIERPDLVALDAFFARPLVLLSLRHQDCVYLVDWGSRDVVWSWGRGELDGPHDATLLENGNVLVFDNGMVRGWSRVLEVDLRSGDIVWQYSGEQGAPFYTRGRGGSQRLPNGNTLIAESNEGRAFEVTRSGRVVWEFFNPRYLGDRRAAIVRMRHYDAAFIESLAARPAPDPDR